MEQSAGISSPAIVLRTNLKKLLARSIPCAIYLRKPRRNVPIQASGPQSEQPLLDMINPGNENRQSRAVAVRNDLALVPRWIALVVFVLILSTSHRSEKPVREACSVVA